MLCNDHRWLDAIELSLAVHRRGYQHFAFLILFNIVYFYLVFINLIIILKKIKCEQENLPNLELHRIRGLRFEPYSYTGDAGKDFR